MPAESIAQLFEFEAQIEGAAVAMLTAAFSDPTVQVIPERSTDELKSPRIEAKLQMGAPMGRRKALPGALSNPQQTLPDRFMAQLVLTTITNRKTPGNGSRHDELLGKVRAAMLLALGGLNAQLPWLLVESINTMGVIPVAQASSDLDMSPEVFALVFSIRADAWPVLPAAV